MAQYFLATHVYLCVTDDHGVLLDLKRDKYVGVGRQQMRILAERVTGWPRPASQTADPKVAPEAFLSKMLESGMLTTDPACGKDAQPVTLPRPQMTLMTPDSAAQGDPFEARPVITFGHILRFCLATLRARAELKWCPISAVVQGALERKGRQSAGGGSLDFETARRLVGVFVYLRPLLFTTQDACLADSLALVHFLAGYGLYPNWVYGVQNGPFAAHCWVQEGEAVFNDTPDHVRRYTPILAI